MFKNPYNVISLLLQFVNKIIGIQIITFLKVRIMIKENNYVLFHFFYYSSFSKIYWKGTFQNMAICRKIFHS